jgi:hypothetical protein
MSGIFLSEWLGMEKISKRETYSKAVCITKLPTVINLCGSVAFNGKVKNQAQITQP